MSSRNSRRRLSRLNPFSRKRSKPTRLAESAERSPEMLEQLEARQLLFTHVMGPGDPIDPQTGLRVFTANFAYVIPMFPQFGTPGNAAAINRLEDFNTDDPGDPGPGAGIPILSGYIFEGSNLRLEHTASQVRLVRENPANQGANLIAVTMQQNETLTFSVAYGRDPAGNLYSTSFRQPRQVRMELSATFNPNNVLVELVNEQTGVVASFTGGALAALAGGVPLPGGAREYTFSAPVGQSFDHIRFTALDAVAFLVDNVAFSLPPGNFARIIDDRIYGATITFVAPIGATIQVLDLLGREMLNRINLGIPENSEPPLTIVDPDDDGQPDFNDGIGRIIMTGTNAQSRLTVQGRIVEPGAPPPNAIRVQGGFYMIPAPGTLFDEFEDAGYLFNGLPGLPEGPGNVIIGSPFVGGFNEPDQGVKLLDGSPFNIVNITGIVHGVSQFNSFLNEWSVGYMLGSLSVQSDLGAFTSGTDAGLWATDDGLSINTTNSFVIVGRSLGTFDVAGRNAMSVTVIGDLNSPNRPPRNTTGVIYVEREGRVPFGPGALGNDTILSAEYVGGSATAVTIVGSNGANVPDPSDVYAFAVSNDRELVIQSPNIGLYLRLVDQDGRVLAASENENPIGLRQAFRDIRYTPQTPGVLYLVVARGANYQVNINGLVPTVFGSYRTGAGLPNIPGLPLGANVQLLSGDMGMIRMGGGFIDSTTDVRPEVDPAVTINELVDESIDERLDVTRFTFSTPGALYNITVGSDLIGLNLSTGGNLGTIVTGLSALVGVGPTSGDFRNSQLNVGGSLAMLDIRGGLGINQDVPRGLTGYPVDGRGSIVVRTGLSIPSNPSLRGDVGFIRVGSSVGEGTMNLSTPANSRVGGIATDQDQAILAADNGFGIYSNNPILSTSTGLGLSLGFNSDLRFFDTPQIDLAGVNDKFLPLIPGQTLSLTDDGGATVNITLNAAVPGRVIVMPIDGSLGVAIGRIEANLLGGGSITITGFVGPNGADVVSIGNIVILNADAGSGINISGTAQVDVWRIQQLAGDAFGTISNTSNFGDIVAADMQALTSLNMGSGSLGRTEMVTWGPRLIGPFLGITGQGSNPGPGEPIIIPLAVVAPLWNGELYRPVNNIEGLPPGPWMDDIGGPANPFLNGIIVRNGDVLSITSNGAIGDVILNDQDGLGTLGTLTANADGVTPTGRFDGIVGTVYANRIAQVDVGDGLQKREQSPLPTTGIFANDDIGSVVGGRVAGAFISSIIASGNSVPGNADALFPVDGINQVRLTGGGSIVDAWIGAMKLDTHWRSHYRPGLDIDPEPYTGTINQIIGVQANLFRTQVWADNINLIQLSSGFYDASVTRVRTNVGAIVATGFRNSTVSGNQSEFFPNEVVVGATLNLLTTFNRAGDIEDLTVDVLGRIIEISGNNLTRSTVDADLEIVRLQTFNDVRSSTITTGLLTLGLVGRSMRSSTVAVSGPLRNLTVSENVVNSNIEVSGPDGRLDLLSVQQNFSGSISVAGNIGLIRVIQGNLTGRILTVTNIRGIPGNIDTISVGRDLDVDADIGGTVNQIIVGRHFGTTTTNRSFVVHGNIFLVDIPNGQLYDDIHVDQSLTGSLRIGAVNNKPGANLLGTGSLYAFGRINNVVISGDFAGGIVSYSGGINTVTINNGSLLKRGVIQAFDGDINSVVVNSGHIFGAIHADYILYLVQVNASADGVFGDLGINPALSQGVPSADPLRNQLPPGVVPDGTIQGPRITAGFNIGRIILTNGSIFEAFIHAGRAIGTISVNGDIRNDSLTSGTGTVIAAGSSIYRVLATGNMSDVIIIAGVRSFGEDGRPGGVGANADTVQSGRIDTVSADGTGTNVIITAGMNAGNDGVYNTGDETVVLGVSYVRNALFAGGVSNASVFADSPTLNASAGVVKAGTNFPLADPDLSDGSPVAGGQITPGVPFGFNLSGGISGTITFTGPGDAYFDITTRKVILVGTSLQSTLLVQANGTLTDFDIVTNDDASMGSITVTAPLAGDSDIVVDAYCFAISVADFSGTGSIRVGMNLRSLTTGNFTGGFIQAAFWVRDIVINGNFGLTGVTGEARIDANASSSIIINGTFAGLVNIERDLGTFRVNGAMTQAQFRAGNSVGSITTGAMSQSRVSAGDHIGPIVINGNVSESNIQAGGDLGSDVAPGGTGFAADRASSGSIASVQVNGNFTRSSVAAGFLRGADGYFGTQDDSGGAGRSNIGPVTITGTQIGSNLGSESFAVVATGTVGTVRVGGLIVTQQGNFKVQSATTRSNPLRVQDVVISQTSNIWFATFYFNQSIDVGSFLPSLSVAEVRDGGLTLVPLVQGVDYILEPIPDKDKAMIRFARTVTDRSLIPQGGPPGPNTSTPGTQSPTLPGPGVFRFTLSSETFRATVSTARLDANPSSPGNDDYSSDFVVGDAGDKFNQQVINNGDATIDMYGPTDLNVVFDNNFTPDGQPDANIRYTIRGAIGDHPDQNVNSFRPAADVDVFRVTLRAGQILRLGAMQGSALFAGRFLLNAAGVPQGGTTADTVALPTDPASFFDLTQPENYLIKTTGTYFIVVSNVALAFLSSTTVPNADGGAGVIGDYNFGIEIFDDADTGFGAPTDSGNGTAVVDAPEAIVFAGPNGVFEPIGTPGSDDLTLVTIGDFRFTLDAGPDGIRGTADDIVSGSNSLGVTSRRQGSSLTSTIFSAIGPTGHSGVPGAVTPDADVWVLNNGQAVAPGTTYKVTVRLADIGADLGSFSRFTATDFRGSVQFGIFDITDSTAVDDGALVFSPTDFKSVAQKQTTISQQGAISYGYNANGDFEITFVTPGKIGGLATDPAVYAIYLQGVFNTDYSILVERTDNAPVAVVPQSKQNILIETRGGAIDWLQAGGLTTTLEPFRASVLGFTGSVGVQTVQDYILSQLVVRLNSIFTGNGLNVVFSTNPAAFEFEDFSRIFVTASNDPIAVFTQQNFGYTEHSDPYNSDRNDEGVVFLPSLGQLGFSSGQADIDDFVLSLTSAVGRRAGELMGLRIEANQSAAANPNSIMRANSVLAPSVNAGFLNELRPLSGLGDSVINTNFFLGQQNAFALLDKFLTP
jgi:hypothetical protein